MARGAVSDGAGLCDTSIRRTKANAAVGCCVSLESDAAELRSSPCARGPVRLAAVVCPRLSVPQAWRRAAESTSSPVPEPDRGHSTLPSRAQRPSIRPRSFELARTAASARPADSGGGALAPGSSGGARRRRKPVLVATPSGHWFAFQAMQKAYYIKGKGLYAGEPYSYLWPFSQALAATVGVGDICRTFGVSFARTACAPDRPGLLLGHQ